MAEKIPCGYSSACEHEATLNTMNGPRCDFHAGWDVAKAHAEREAYIKGAKDFVAEAHAEARKIAGKRATEYRDFGAALLTVEYDLVRGDWPKETPDG
jgi:hypothetical protein